MNHVFQAEQNFLNFFKSYFCMLADEFKKLLSLGIKIMMLISRWKMLASEMERKCFDISAQILTSFDLKVLAETV